MKLPIALSLPMTLAVSLAAYACSSSGSSASPGSDASTPDDAGVVSSGNGDDASNGLGDASNTTTDANGDVSDASTGNTLDSSTPTLDSSINTLDASTSATDAGALSFATDIYAPILEVHCVGCHALQADGGQLSGVQYGKLDMSTVDAAYANLVNVPAAGVSCAEVGGSAGPVRVVPGNAASSLLWDKVNAYLDPPAVCGGAMPKSGEIPDGGQEIVAAQIQTWINQGARP